MTMCQDLGEYDPFEPLILMEYDGETWIDSEPMNDYDWEEWLEVDDG